MEFLVVQDYGLESEAILYAGESELKAYSVYKSIKGKKNLFKANIKRTLIHNIPFVVSFEVIQEIR